jgi:hypothetical protein
MVIRTEYRGQRYSMGSSDPLPAGLEIRFGGLNFQATGNGYLMRLTNREELRARHQAGSAPVAATRVATAPTPANTDACRTIGATTPSPLWPALASGAVGAPACCVRHLTTQRAHRCDGRRPGGGALRLRATLPHQSARCHGGLRRQRQRQHHDA